MNNFTFISNKQKKETNRSRRRVHLFYRVVVVQNGTGFLNWAASEQNTWSERFGRINRRRARCCERRGHIRESPSSSGKSTHKNRLRVALAARVVRWFVGSCVCSLNGSFVPSFRWMPAQPTRSCRTRCLLLNMYTHVYVCVCLRVCVWVFVWGCASACMSACVYVSL